MSTVTPDVDDDGVASGTGTATVTGFGRPSVELLARRVTDAKAGDPLAPVTVVVPSNHAAVAARRALAGRPGGNGVLNVTFLTLHRLAERLGGPALAGAGRRPVSAAVLAVAVRDVLAREPGVFAPVADHPATEQALVAAHRELSLVTEAALDAVAGASPRAADVVRIHRAVRARLAARWFDEADLLASAAAHVADDAAAVRAELGPVVLHHLTDVTPPAAAFLATVGEVTTVHAHVALTGEPDADRAVVVAHERAGFTVPGPTIESPRAGALISASDPDDEVRAAVRRITRWMHDGVPLGRIAVLYATAEPYARLLHEQLGAAAIPFNGTPVRTVGDLLLGRTLRALLALPDRNYHRADVLAVLTGAPLVDAAGRRVHSRRWEQLSRDAGIVGGDDWEPRLTRLAADASRRADEEEADGNEGRAARRRRDAEEAVRLAAFVQRLRADVDRGRAAATWTALVQWAHGLLGAYVGDADRRHAWPDAEQEAAHRVEAALDGLAGLDTVGGPAPTVATFRRTLEGELASSLRRQGRMGEGVLVGSVAMAAGLVLDRVVVLGLAEGLFPPRRLDDSLLPDRERERADGELPLRARRVDDDRRNLLAAIAAADEAVLCHPRGDLRRTGERPASRWFLVDAARLAGVPAVRSGDLRSFAGEPWFEHVDSFAGGVARTTVHASLQELRLAAVARGDGRSALLTGDPTLVAARDAVRSRRSADFTRFDGNLKRVAARLREVGVVSASRLQAWAVCPHAFLLQYVLGVEPIVEPERRIEIDALDTGTLVHEILDAFVKDALDRDDGVRQWDDADRARLHRLVDAKFAEAEAKGMTGRALLWARDSAVIRADLDRFLDEDNRRMAELGVVPVSTERTFDAVPVTLPSGRVLHVRGSVDRIDRAADGSLVVLDYKTGSAKRYEGLGEDDPHRGGTQLQLYLYAVAARHELGTDAPIWSGYWFNTSRRKFARIGYPVSPSVEAEVGRAIDTIVDGITAGLFPARPPEKPAWTHVDCWYCTPDRLSSTERRRDWERKRAAPELAAYVALCEPEGVDA